MTTNIPSLPLDIAREFPVTRNWVYMNHAGVAPLPQRVAFAIKRYAEEAAQHGAVHYENWRNQLQTGRELASLLLECAPLEIAYVKNTTHGLLCVANSIDWKAGDNVVTFEGEFPANYWPWKNLEERGVEVRYASLVDGRPSLENLEKIIDDRTRLAAVSFVGYANGYRIDAGEFGRICRHHNVFSCLDGIQGLGAVPVQLKGWGIDFFSADDHKWLLGPEGFGVLYCSNRVLDRLNRSMTGWCGHANYSNYENRELPLFKDARRFEEGSHNMACAHAFVAALELFLEVGMELVYARLRALTRALADGLTERGWTLTSPNHDDAHWSGIVSAHKPGVDPRDIESKLKAAKVIAAARAGRLRFSPHFYNSGEEVDRALAALD